MAEQARALVTRPREDAAGLCAALATRGIVAVIEPVLQIRWSPEGAGLLAPLLPGSQALLFTSANGARAFAAASQRRDIAVFAVGDASAQAARAAGFTAVESAGGDVAALAALVARRLDPAKGALLHVAASDVAGDLAGDLARRGFETRRLALYDAAPVKRLSDGTRRLIAQGGIGFALFFSPRSAAGFVRLAGEAGLLPSLARIGAVGLSAAVTAELSETSHGETSHGEVSWRWVASAAAPNEASLLAALDRARGGQPEN
jgi:uroporphyrinogen-III synthase